MKFLKSVNQTIQGATWLVLQLLAHVLLIVGCIVTLLHRGIEESLVTIKAVNDGLIKRIGE